MFKQKFEIFLEYFKISLMIDCLECLVLSTYFEGVYFQPKIILLEKWKLLLMAYNKLSSGCQNNVYIKYFRIKTRSYQK